MNEEEEEQYIPEETVQDHEAKTEEPAPKIWRSCCLTADKEAVKYLLTYLLSASILAFSFIMASTADDTRLTIWVSIISGISGQYLPSPFSPPH